MSKEELIEFNIMQLSEFLTNEEILRAYKKLEKLNDNKKEKIDKAIEYIEDSYSCRFISEDVRNKIIKILKGE